MLARRAGAASVPYVGSVPITDDANGNTPTGTLVERRSVPFLLIDPGFDRAYDLTLHNLVVRAPAGTLDFYYRVTNGSDRPLRLTDMDTGRFSRPGSADPIDVNLWDEAAGAFAPVRAERSTSYLGGVALHFPSSDELAPGESSRLFFIRTAATDYQLGGLTQFRSTPGTTSDNGFAVTFNPVLTGPLIPPPPPVLPVTTIPLPPGAGAAAFGLLTVGAAMRRPRRPTPE